MLTISVDIARSHGRKGDAIEDIFEGAFCCPWCMIQGNISTLAVLAKRRARYASERPDVPPLVAQCAARELFADNRFMCSNRVSV